MVRLARDSAESPGRRRTPPAGHVAGNLAGKGETDDWALVPETFFRSGGAGMHVAGRRGVGQVEHLRSRLDTLGLVVLAADARSSFLSTATLDLRGADPLCSIADAANNFSPWGLFHDIPRQIHVAKPI